MEAFKDEKTFGPYQLHARIAEGGMAEVVLGTSQQKEFQGQFLAIKRLRPHLNSNKPFVNLLIHFLHILTYVH
jgi:serine/threonine protein kinase